MRDYTNSEMESLISEHIHSDRDAEIMRLRLIYGHTYERIAEEIKPQMSPRHVFRIASKNAAKLFRFFENPPES